jgi:hypothetical protein
MSVDHVLKCVLENLLRLQYRNEVERGFNLIGAIQRQRAAVLSVDAPRSVQSWRFRRHMVLWWLMKSKSVQSLTLRSPSTMNSEVNLPFQYQAPPMQRSGPSSVDWLYALTSLELLRSLSVTKMRKA